MLSLSFVHFGGRIAFRAAFSAALLLGATAVAQAETTLLILSEDVPIALDEDGPGVAHPASQAALVNMLEPLVRYAVKGTNDDGMLEYDFNKFVPALAESWSYDAATLTWTFNLRHGAKSCAGNTLSADDVLYTLARAKSLTGSPAGFSELSAASVAGFTTDLFGKTPEIVARRALGDEVKKIDDYTVQIRQSAPNKLLLPAIANVGVLILDSIEMKKHATPDDPWSHTYGNTENTASYAPYCLESWQKQQQITVHVNPNYWGPKPSVDRIIIRKVPQSSNRIAVLRSGGAQIIDGLNPKELDSLRTVDNVKVVGGYLNSTAFLLANYKIPPFDNVKLRQAIAYAVPYADLIKAAYFGQATQWDGLVPTRYPGFHKSSESYSFDPAKAKQLLADAGYPDGKGLDAFADAFKLAYASERESTLGPVVTLIRTRLRQIGIPLQLDPMPASQMSNRFLIQRNLPIGIWDQTKPYVVDAVFAINLWYLSPPAGLLNMSNYSNAEVDKLFNQAKIEPDNDKRNQYLAGAQDILMQTLPYIPIVETKLQFATQTGVSGLALQNSQQLSWKDLKMTP
jgi:peptide/nickel transport system substrate-binding protein